MRDLYEILDVARDAGEDEIKRAYRRRARELHPDTGGDEEEFKELTTAYEVLKNPQARANYDRFGDPRGPGGVGGSAGGDPFAGFGDLSDLIDTFFGGFGGARGGGRAAAANRGGRDVLVDLQLTLEDAASGVRRDVEVSVQRTCDVCDGSGARPGGEGAVRCHTCGGAGMVQQVRQSVFGQMLSTTTCPTCRGAGTTIADPCEGCSGQGRRQTTETVTVDVPPGVDDGTRLRLTGRGEAGRNGAASGDLYVRMRLSRHAVFTREGNDLHCELPLPMAQAALGGELTLPTLDGEAEVRIPPGTQAGDVITLRRHGMPKLNGGGARGNLHVHCRVETPTRLTDEQEQLLRDFSALRGEDLADAAPEGRGLFGRIREAFGA